MKKIKLTQGKYALVDDEDLDYLNQWNWYYTSGYAARWQEGKRIYMHRLVNKTPRTIDTDHINRDKLDNRKANLRIATRSQNVFNRCSKHNKSGVIGVSWHKTKGKWRANIMVNYKQIFLGYFSNLEEASVVRKKAEKQYYETI